MNQRIAVPRIDIEAMIDKIARDSEYDSEMETEGYTSASNWSVGLEEDDSITIRSLYSSDGKIAVEETL